MNNVEKLDILISHAMLGVDRGREAITLMREGVNRLRKIRNISPARRKELDPKIRAESAKLKIWQTEMDIREIKLGAVLRIFFCSQRVRRQICRAIYNASG